jgi:hypothetical protein
MDIDTESGVVELMGASNDNPRECDEKGDPPTVQDREVECVFVMRLDGV